MAVIPKGSVPEDEITSFFAKSAYVQDDITEAASRSGSVLIVFIFSPSDAGQIRNCAQRRKIK
jgi:hypothetical protein